MPRVEITPILRRHLDCADGEVAGETVREVLEALFADNPRLRSYLLDDQGALRQHVNVFVDGEAVVDRRSLGDAVAPDSAVVVMQALSGGRGHPRA